MGFSLQERQGALKLLRDHEVWRYTTNEKTSGNDYAALKSHLDDLYETVGAEYLPNPSRFETAEDARKLVLFNANTTKINDLRARTAVARFLAQEAGWKIWDNDANYELGLLTCLARIKSAAAAKAEDDARAEHPGKGHDRGFASQSLNPKRYVLKGAANQIIHNKQGQIEKLQCRLKEVEVAAAQLRSVADCDLLKLGFKRVSFKDYEIGNLKAQIELRDRTVAKQGEKIEELRKEIARLAPVPLRERVVYHHRVHGSQAYDMIRPSWLVGARTLVTEFKLAEEVIGTVAQIIHGMIYERAMEDPAPTPNSHRTGFDTLAEIDRQDRRAYFETLEYPTHVGSDDSFRDGQEKHGVTIAHWKDEPGVGKLNGRPRRVVLGLPSLAASTHDKKADATLKVLQDNGITLRPKIGCPLLATDGANSALAEQCSVIKKLDAPCIGTSCFKHGWSVTLVNGITAAFGVQGWMGDANIQQYGYKVGYVFEKGWKMYKPLLKEAFPTMKIPKPQALIKPQALGDAK